MSGGPEDSPSGGTSRAGGLARGGEAEGVKSAGSAAHAPTVSQTRASGTLLTIVKGDPSPGELAALVAVVAALDSGSAEAPAQPRPEWNAAHRLVRTPHSPGPGGWRSSGLPR